MCNQVFAFNNVLFIGYKHIKQLTENEARYF